MTDGLVERVARAIALGVEDDPDEWELYAPPARAAIRVVVDECARVVEKTAFGWINGDAVTNFGKGYQSGCKDAADTIRALLEGGK